MPKLDSTILVPVDISAPEEFDKELLELFGPMRVVLLGYYPVPDQSAPEQLRDEFEEEAAEALERLADDFDKDTDVETVLVFTRDRDKTVERVGQEHDTDAVLTGGEVDTVQKVLVPIRGDPNLDNIAEFVGALMQETDATVTLLHVAGDEEEESTGEYILRGVSDRLKEDGVDPERVCWEQTKGGSPENEITDFAKGYDVLVIGETEPSLRKKIFGDVPTKVVRATDMPVLIVRGDA